MPTKEEILKKHTDEFDKYLDGDCEYSGNPCFTAMEEYAKQEVLAFLNHNVYWNLTEIQFEEIWNEYQKSKLKK